MGVKFMSLAFVIIVVTESSRGNYVGDGVGNPIVGNVGIGDGRIVDTVTGNTGGFVGDKVLGNVGIGDGRIVDTITGDRGGFVGDVLGNGGIGGGRIIDNIGGDGRILDAIDRVGDGILRDRGIVDRVGEALLGDRGIADKLGERILGGRRDARFRLFSAIRQMNKNAIDSVRGRARNIGLGTVVAELAQNIGEVGGRILNDGQLLRDGGALAKNVGEIGGRILNNRQLQKDGGALVRGVLDAISRPRLRRAAPKNFANWNPMRVNVANAQGNTYTWTRDFGLSSSVEETAFSSEDRKMVVVLSFDANLLTQNRTPAATMYDFSKPEGVVAIKPMRRGPCYLMDTSWTYEEVISELGIRNGSSVSTSMVVSLDGTGDPIPQEERRALFTQTPSLRRQCRGRGIVRTKPIGLAPMNFEGDTADLKIFTLDSEVNIVTRSRGAQGAFANFSRWFQGLTQGRFFGGGQGQNRGRGRGQGQSQGRGRGLEKNSGGDQTQGSP